MDLIQKFMNIVVPPIALTTLFFFLPSYLFFKFILSTLGTIFSENVAGKVVLITGASSGIGEHLAYEYARRGACLALVARRENSLREVASIALHIYAFVGDFLEIFGCFISSVDHLVNNAGVTPVCMFEDYDDITKSTPACTYFAVPHLRNSKGKIIGIASSAGWLRAARMSVYNASKAAVISFYETLRVEVGMDIGITIVTPGLIESEMTKGKFVSKEGTLVLDQEMRDVLISLIPVESVERCAKAIVNGACRGNTYLTEPAWIRMTLFWNAIWPEIQEWMNRWLLLTGPEASPREALSKQILELTGAKKYLYPETLLSPELKGN